jgi:hypothetical protein
MARYRWEVDADYPQGHAVELTPEEESQLEAEQAAWAVVAEGHAVEEENAETMRGRLHDSLYQTLVLADAFEADTATEEQQREAIELCLRGLARVTRLQLTELDQAD